LRRLFSTSEEKDKAKEIKTLEKQKRVEQTNRREGKQLSCYQHRPSNFTLSLIVSPHVISADTVK
jgi:hypothetical protein